MSSAFLRATPFAVLLAHLDLPAPKANIEFTRDIRPILSEECFRCHAPTRRPGQADFGLTNTPGSLWSGETRGRPHQGLGR